MRVAGADLLASFTSLHVQRHDPPFHEDVNDVLSSL